MALLTVSKESEAEYSALTSSEFTSKQGNFADTGAESTLPDILRFNTASAEILQAKNVDRKCKIRCTQVGAGPTMI